MTHQQIYIHPVIPHRNRPYHCQPVPFIEQHCYNCHDSETKKGGLDLTSLSFESQHLGVDQSSRRG